MYRSINYYDETPPRIYRSAEDIRADIFEIAEKIKECEEMMTVRELLMVMLTEWSGREPAKWVGELEETVEAAREALLELERLRDALDDLEAELEEVKCLVRR